MAAPALVSLSEALSSTRHQRASVRWQKSTPASPNPNPIETDVVWYHNQTYNAGDLLPYFVGDVGEERVARIITMISTGQVHNVDPLELCLFARRVQTQDEQESDRQVVLAELTAFFVKATTLELHKYEILTCINPSVLPDPVSDRRVLTEACNLLHRVACRDEDSQNKIWDCLCWFEEYPRPYLWTAWILHCRFDSKSWDEIVVSFSRFAQEVNKKGTKEIENLACGENADRLKAVDRIQVVIDRWITKHGNDVESGGLAGKETRMQRTRQLRIGWRTTA